MYANTWFMRKADIQSSRQRTGFSISAAESTENPHKKMNVNPTSHHIQKSLPRLEIKMWEVKK